MHYHKLHEYLEKELTCISADIEYMEESGTAFTREYTKLVKTKKIVMKTIKKLKRIGK